jgi:DNA-binding IclR family transcriptional regulator
MPRLKKPTKQTDRHVEAVLAALGVLDCFLSNFSMTIRQLMECTGFTRNRVIRLTGTLLHGGYLMPDSIRGAYMLGPKVWTLNKVFEQEHGIILLARPILREVAMKTGESSSLFVRDGFERVVLVREEGTQTVRYNLTEGQRMEIYTGATGKVLLAYAKDEVLKALFSSPIFVKRSPNTVADAVALQRDLKKIRQQGFAESAGERISDAGAVSAPVFDGTGDILGALGLAGALSRFTPEATKRYVKIVVAAAKKMSVQLGWKPPH